MEEMPRRQTFLRWATVSTVGFAPTLGIPNGFTARRLNFSAMCSASPP
jgi:hypothetical protein